MPIYNLNNKRYNIPDDVVADFERDNPEAIVSYSSGDKVYDIPVNKRDRFLKKYPDAKPYADNQTESSKPYDHVYDENMNLVGGAAYDDITKGSYKQDPKVRQYILDNKPDMFKPKTVDMYGAHDKEKSEFDLMNEGKLYQMKAMRAASTIGEQLDERIKANESALNEARKKQAEGKLQSSSNDRGRYSSVGLGGTIKERQEAYEKSYGKSPSRVEQTNMDDDVANLLAEQEYLKESKKVFDAAKNDSGFFQGMKDAIDASYLSFGLTDMLSAERISVVQQKLESGHALTDSEQSLLTSLGLQQMVNEQYNDLLGRWYKAGMVTAEMAPFMAEMAVNPLSGLGKSATKFAVKKFGEKGAKAIAAKVLSRTVGDVAGAAGMAATTGMPGVAADAMERQRGYVTTELGDKGTIKGVGFEGGENASDAWRKSFTARTIENWSEMVGEYFSPVGKAVGKGFSKAFDKMGLSKVNDFIDNINSSEWVKLLDDFSERTQWNGPLGEFAEEQVGMIANAALVGDTKWSDITDLDKQLDVALGVGVFGTAMSLLRIGGYRTPKYRARKAVEGADKEGAKLYGEELWETVKFSIDNSSDEELGNVLATMIAATGANQEQAEAAFKYANALKAQQAVNTVKEKTKIDMPDDMEVEVEAAYDEGSELETPLEKHEAKRTVDRAERALGVGSENSDEQQFAQMVMNGVDSPVETVNAMAEQGYTEEQIQKAKDYYTAVHRMNGLTDALLDKVDSQIESANAEVDANTNINEDTKEQTIVPVTLRDGRQGYVVSGSIVPGEEGSINIGESDKVIVVRVDGKNQQMNPNQHLQSVGAITTPDALKQYNNTQLKQKLIDQAIGEIDWNPATPNPKVGDSFEVNGVPVVVAGMNENGLIVVLVEEWQKAQGKKDYAFQSQYSVPVSEYKNWASAQLDTQEDAQAMVQQESVSGENVGEQVNTGVNFPVNNAAQQPAEEVNPIGKGVFGYIYNQFKGKLREGVAFLIKKRSGVLQGVLNRKEVGDIDLVWGNTKAGLAHIITKHVVNHDDFSSVENAISVIEDVVTNGEISIQKDGRVAFSKDGYRVAIDRNEDGNWIVTALDTSRKQKEKKRSEQDATRLHQSIFGEENGELVSPQSASLSTNKDSDKNVQSQENKAKPFYEREKEEVFRELGEMYGEKMPHKVEVTAKAWADKVKKAQKKVDDAQKKLDDAPIGEDAKQKTARDKAKTELEAIRKEADFWAEMDAEIKNAKAKREAVLNPQADVVTSTEPMTTDEFIAQQLAAGNIVLSKEDYMAQTGYGNEEVKSMNGGTQKLITDNGMTLDAAGERLMEMDRENGTNFFNQDDATAGRDALIALLGSVRTRKELNQYIAENRKAQAKKESEAIRNASEEYVMSGGYESLEDYLDQMEAAEVENPFLEDRADEIMAIFAEEAAKYEQSINNTENGQGTENEASEGSYTVLPEESSDDTAGAETDNESASAGNGVDEEGEGAYDGEQGERLKGGRRIPTGFGKPKKTTEELFAEEQAKFASAVNNDYAEVLTRSNSVEEAINEFKRKEKEARERANDWRNRKYKDNNVVVRGVNPYSGADSYETTIGAANERRREANVRNALAEAEKYRSYAETLAERTNYIDEQDSEVDSSQKRILDVFNEASRIAAKHRREQIKARVKMWEAAGVKVKVHERTSGIHNMDVRRAIMSGEIVAGWYDGEAHIYLPHISSLAELDKTILHEAVSHMGLRELMGKENFDKLCDKVWEMMPKSAQDEFINYPGVNGKTRAAADEYMAHLAEDENLSPEEKNLWQKIVQWFKDLFTAKVGDKEQAVSILNQSRLTNKDISELLKLSYANLKSNAAERIEENVGEVDAEKGDVRFAVRDVLKGEEREQAIKDLMAVTGRSRRTVVKWLKAEESLASVILNEDNVGILDMEADESVPSIWKNSDYPQGTVEFSNICKKRLPFTTIYQRLQKEFPDTLFDAQTLNTIRNTMKEMGEDVACALCFVEDRRQLLGEIGQGFIDAVKGMDVEVNDNQKVALDKLRESGDKYVPNLFDIITLDGMKELRKKHPAVAQAFIEYNNARGMQSGRLFQAYSAYNREILKYNKKKVESINNNGGLRIFSFSDFEAHHLIDLVQVLTDCAAKGLKVQGYTKVPEFAKAVKDTNAKINRSLIPKGVGYVDADYVPEEGEAVSPNVINGKRLLFDTIEGIDVNNPNFFDSTGSKSVGNILVAINDEHARLAMADPFVDYIIGFHTGQSKAILKGKGIDTWVNYKNEQLDKEIVTDESGNQKMKNAPHHGLNIYTDVLNVAEAEGNPIKTAKQFTERFLEECAKRGYVPRFSRFLNRAKDGRFLYTPGYHKFLIDFKLFDKNGRILPQEAVVPKFDDAFNKQILDDYVKGVKEEIPNDAVYEAVKEAVGLGEGTRFRFSKSPEEFDAIQKEAVEKKGIVMPGLNEAVVDVLSIDKHDFNGNLKQAREEAKQWASENYQGKEFSLPDEGGSYTIGKKAINKYVDKTSIDKSDNAMIHLSALKELPNIISSSVTGEIHADYKKDENGERNADNGIGDKGLLVHRMYGAIKLDGKTYRVKTTMNEYRDPLAANNPHSYEVTEIELIESSSTPSLKDDSKLVNVSNNSITGTKLLNGVEKSYDKGKKLLDESEKTRFRVTPEYKQHQMDIINETNPASDDVHTWIRGVDDIKSFEEALDDSDYADYKGEDFDPSYTWNMVEDALETGKVTVYSSYPIKNGVFVTPSYMEAQSYGGTTPYIAKVNLEDVAWIDPTQGQLATDNKVTSTKAPSGVRFRMTNAEKEALRDSEETKALFEYAKKRFGRTFDLREAGYVLPDGSMLDFSGRHEMSPGSDTSFLRGDRTVDHRYVKDLNYEPEDDGGEKTGFKTDMADFINRGAIRIDNKFGLINLSMKPTKDQKVILQRLIQKNDGDVYLDFADGWNAEHHAEYEGVRPMRIFSDIDKYYDEGIKPEGNTRFRIANKNQEIFVSNAQKAVEGIKQEKGTPKQWLAMIEKNGGLKAGEDKWLGLSDWLKSLDKKSVAKAEILEFINQNKIRIEEVRYAGSVENYSDFEPLIADYKGVSFRDSFFDAFNVEFDEFYISNEQEAVDLYNKENGTNMSLDEYGYLEERDEETLIEWAQSVMSEAREASGVNPISSIRLEYTTEGLENKAEIALTVPTIEPWGKDDEVHFGDAGEGRAVAWIRFGETKDSEGNKVLVIDEIQSKRHQNGRERGYISKEELEKRKKAKIEAKSLQEERERLVTEQLHAQGIAVDADDVDYDYDADAYDYAMDGRLDGADEAAMNRIVDINTRLSELDYKTWDVVPEAPFEKNWSELAMKRMLRYAAENGFDKVAWTTGMQQAERYDLGTVAEEVRSGISVDGERITDIYFRDGSSLNMYHDENGNIERIGGIRTDLVGEAKNISEVIGKEIASKILTQSERGSKGIVKYTGIDLSVGSEGMKAFYDKMLPSFVNKYVKKWGTKVQDIELPLVEKEGRIMHSVDVTDAMKESVMEGQTMFRISEKGKRIQTEVDKFTAKYDSKEVVVVEVSSMSDKEIEDMFNSPADEVREAMDEGLSGGYNLLTDKIYIFVDNQSLDELEETMFHENMHPSFHGDKMIGAFDEAVKDNTKKMRASLRERGYREDEIAEEVFVRITTDALLKGDFKNIEKYLPEEYKEDFYNKLKEFGYDTEEKIGRRTGSDNQEVRTSRSEEQGASEEVVREGRAGQYILSGRRDSGRSDDSENGPNGSKRAALEEVRNQAEQIRKFFDQVADMGLEGVIGNAEYNRLMLDIFHAMPKDIHGEISVNAVKNLNLDVAKAVSDYLGANDNPSVWEKVVGMVRDALRKVGFDLELTPNDVKYMLWRSKKPLNRRQALDVAEDIAKRSEFGVGEDSGTRFRTKKAVPFDPSDKRDKLVKAYDAFLKTGKFNFIEAFQDRMYSVKVMMDMIVDVTGKKVRDFEDAYTAENQLGSINKPEEERYLKDFYKPLVEVIRELSDKYGREVVERYIYCKSGLERNEVLRQRDADEAYNDAKAELDDKLAKGQLTQPQYDALLQQADDQRQKTLAEDVDYSGIRGMLYNVKAQAINKDYEENRIDKATRDARLAQLEANKKDEVKDWKQFAEDQVAALEAPGKASKAELDKLWKKINAATNETLRMDYESGMIDKETYDAEKNMMKYYVPLRNWADTTAEEMYEYRSELVRPVSSNQKRAKGRESQADNPIATIALMAQNAIVRGNRNKVKQKFYAFVANRETGLASVRDVWYEKDSATGDWTPKYADTSKAKDAAEFAQILDDFENSMKLLEEQGLAYKGKLPFGMKFRASRQQKMAHVVPVMINGKEYAVYVNGNPRPAQAINGETNSEAANASAWYDKIKRIYGAGLTSWNPDFIIPNMIRDGIHASTMTFLDAGPWAAIKFAANGPRAFGQVFAMVSGVKKHWVNPKYQAYFEEFVANGGETGYTAIHTLEDYKKEYDKLMKEVKGLKGKNLLKGGLEGAAKWLEAANRIFEDVNRFNAYVSARESGESIMRSVNAAKNITVNFNRKGALSANNTTFGIIANAMSKWILFFNPAVQGLAQLVTKTKVNKKRAAMMASTILASGFFMPMFNEALVAAAGDDEEDDYWNQSDFKRRNNWLLFTGDGYVSVPLPPVLRELYGIGDIIYGSITGRIPAERAVMDMARQIQSAIGFINLIPEVSQEPDAVTWAKGFAPDVAAPILDVLSNTNFMGRPIAKWTDFNKYDPEYERVYKGVSPQWVELSKMLNEMGGQEGRRSDVWGNFINPAMMEHLFTSYGGGIGKTINNLAGMALDAMEGNTENLDPYRKSPIAPRFYIPNDEKTVVPGINRKYYDYDYKYNIAKKAYKNYQEGVRSKEHPEWQKYIDEMKSNGELRFIQFFEQEAKKVKKLQNLIKEEPKNKKELEEKLIDVKAEIAVKCYEMLK